MQKKLKNKKGFTLAELLVVVAIIAVLVAIAIPVFGSALGKAQHATNLANVRAAYAEKLIDYMTEDAYDGGAINFDVGYLASVVPSDCTITCSNGTGITVVTDGKYSDTFPVDGDVKFSTESSSPGTKS